MSQRETKVSDGSKYYKVGDQWMSEQDYNDNVAAGQPVERASKNDQEKADLSLVPFEALEAAARAFMVGEKKYGRYNYYKGHKTSQLIAAMMRHAAKFMDGEENDPIDGQPHLGSVIACAAMILKQRAVGSLVDDRYKSEDSK